MVPAQPRKAGDFASLQTLEVVIVASLMLSAVIFVVTFETPHEGSAPVRSLVQQQADDALAILIESSHPDGDSMLSVYILECMQGDCTNLDQKMRKLLPKGGGYAVYLSNGASTFVVYESRPPPGEAVTSRRSIEPAWSHTFVATGIDSVNPAQDALVTYVLPIHKSNPLAPGGSPLLVRVHGTRTSDGADYVMTGSYSTLAYDAADATRASAASLYFADGAGAPLATTDVRSTTLEGGGSPTLANVPFRLRLAESAGVPIPANTTLTVNLPAGWVALASQASNSPNWLVTHNATDFNGSYSGSEIVARLLRNVESETIDFRFNATYRGDAVDHYPFHASLARGASSTASLLVRANAHATQPVLEMPSIHLSAPKPMGATATTTWTLAAFVPDGGGLLETDGVDVTSIEIVEGDGAAIFGAVNGLSGGGSWSSEGDRLVWTGTHRLEHGAPLGLTFTVTASGQGGATDARGGFVAPVTFDGWTGRILTEVAPGLFRGTFLPASGDYKGYSKDTGLSISKEHTLQSNGVFRTTLLAGGTNYTVGNYAGMRDTPLGSYIAFEERRVPIGGTLEADINVQSTLYTLAMLGREPDVTMRVYPPWAHEPTGSLYEQRLLNRTTVASLGGLLALLDLDLDGEPEAGNQGRYDVTLPIPESWLFGTYVVEVEIAWSEEVSDTIGGTILSQTLPRATRIYDYFVVTPHDGLMPPSPVYDVHLVTWLDDWR